MTFCGRPSPTSEAPAALLEWRKVNRMTPDTAKTVLPAILIGLGACWMLVSVVMLVRQRRKDRQAQQHWQHESRVHQRVQELLVQEYELLLAPEERQRREAQRRHLQALRARAETELAAEAHEQKGRRRG